MNDIIEKAKNLPLPDLADAIELYRKEARFCVLDPANSHLSVIYKLRESFSEKCDYLEIGSLFGYSMVHAIKSETPGTFIGVDLFENTGFIAMNDYRPDVVERGLSLKKTTGLVKECNSHQHVVNFVSGNSQLDSTFDKVREISPEFDLIFIDGDHSHEGTLKDFKRYSPLLRKGGFLLFDDQDYPGIRKVIQHIRLLDEKYTWIEWSGFGEKFKGVFIKC